MLNVFTQDEDAVAYTIARKHVTSAAGEERDVILVAVRGSYGSEWLSNLDFMVEQHREASDVASAARAAAREGLVPDADDIETAKDLAQASAEHPGYEAAAQEVCRAVEPWIAESHERGCAVSLVMMGHSRGGAVANLAAAHALEARAGDAAASELVSMATGDEVSAYTFAAPRVTVSDTCHNETYASIFNIIHPADLMPSLPLEAWGYERYGVDLSLPAEGDEGFDERYARMQDAFAQVMDHESTFDPAQAASIRTLVSQISALVPTVSDLLTPNGIATALGACMVNVNPVTVLEGHYPSVYIAWMQALSAEELVRG